MSRANLFGLRADAGDRLASCKGVVFMLQQRI